MCTNNYSNKEKFDKVIAKIKWCIFLPHSVHVDPLRGHFGPQQCRLHDRYGWRL